jgi:hypothetical protein
VTKTEPCVTYSQLQELPWSRHHDYELFDGQLITREHGERCGTVGILHWFLAEMRQAGYVTTPPMLDGHWYVDEHNAYKPDVLYPGYEVVQDESGDVSRNFVFPPILAIDVLEPPSRTPEPQRLDAYARAGLQWYWVVDEEVPSYMIFKLVDSVLVQQAAVEGDDVLDVQEPFALKLWPSEQLT